MYEAPEAVHSLTDKCNCLVVKFLRLLKQECGNVSYNGYVWSPLGPLFSNDECGVINNEMFETFCLPELIKLSGEFGSIGMHCCANAQHQFALFRKVPGFYAFNRVPTTIGWEGDNALDELGGFNGPVMIPTHPNPASIKTMLDKAPEGTRFIFINPKAESIDEAAKWLELVGNFVAGYCHAAPQKEHHDDA